MKKNLFISAYKLFVSALLLPFVITSCQKNAPDVLPDNTNDVTSSANARRTGLSPVALILTVNNTTGYKITSDGGGDYVNGLQNVSASFDQYGNLQFDTNPGINNKTKPNAVRWMNFTFDTPTSGYSVVYPANITTHPKGNYRMVTVTQTPAQSMLNNTFQTIRLGGGFADGSSTDWNFSFQYNNVANTSYATLTRIDNNTWTITGATNPPIARLISNGAVIGFYYLPFSFTLTKL
jgi:hypothetical protein